MASSHHIPACLFPLRTEEAQHEYDVLAQALSDESGFSVALHRALSSYAIQVDTIIKAGREGKQVRGSWFIQMDRARAKLKLEDLEKRVPAPQQPRANSSRTADLQAALCPRPRAYDSAI